MEANTGASIQASILDIPKNPADISSGFFPSGGHHPNRFPIIPILPFPMKTTKNITRAITILSSGNLAHAIILAKPLSILSIINHAEYLGHSLPQSIAIASFLKGFIPYNAYKNLLDKNR